ncbi:MAG: FAD-dependent oxidoreductase [Planctomycetaceae bacterium]
MKSTTPWQNPTKGHFPKLSGELRCDVAIVGGGITGLTAGYLLKNEGKRVVVLDRDRVGSGDTGCTTGHLTHVTDLRLPDLVALFGRDTARLVWKSGVAAIDMIEQIIRTIGADCEFCRVPAFLHLPLAASTHGKSAALESECQLANDLGFAASFNAHVPGIHQPGIRYPKQAKLHPLRYLSALSRAVDGNGSAVFEHSPALEFAEKPRVVRTDQGRVYCDYVVIATHDPLVGEGGFIGATLLQTKLALYSTYAIGARVRSGELIEASYWDTADPYNYLRIDRADGYDYAIYGGEDHKTGQAKNDQQHARLEERLRRVAPDAQVNHRWSGQVIQTPDGLPYMGETADRQFAATGFAGNGLTFGTLAGMMACDAVFGRRNPWQETFHVGRKTVRGTFAYLKENLDYPYYLVRDRLAHAEAASVDEIRPGEGKIVIRDGRRIACARNEAGELTSVSAVCTHMGCIVHWNPLEKTWECPCHGSRFQPTGEVLAGPAESALAAAQ